MDNVTIDSEYTTDYTYIFKFGLVKLILIYIYIYVVFCMNRLYAR